MHAQLLRCDGCPLDALALATHAALRCTRIPKLEVTAATEQPAGSAAPKYDLDLDESLDESVAFDCSALPTYVTLATVGGLLVADCTSAERRAAGSALSLALNPRGEVCAVRMAGGGFGVHLLSLADMMQTARHLCAGLNEAAAAAIGSAAEAGADQRRACQEGRMESMRACFHTG